MGITFAVLLLVFIGVMCVMMLAPGNTEYKKFLDPRDGSQRNILIAGVDKDGVRADVIMLLCTDSKENTLNLVSIPRDTRVTVNGKSFKINACLGRENGEALLTEQVRKLTGMPVNSFCKVNFEGLRNIIDILGGVEYDVPIDMDYDDPAQDLHIHLKAGPQRLDGADAEGLLRFRSGYANADLGRIDTQQDFIKQMAKQKLKLKYIFKLPAVIGQLNNTLDTDMSGFDVLCLAWDFKSGDKAEFNSCVLPGTPKYIGGVSYYIAAENADEQLDILFYESGSESDLNDKVIE